MSHIYLNVRDRRRWCTLFVDDLKKLLHGGKITLPEFVRFSGDVNRRNLAAEAADDDDEVSDMGGIRRRQNNW